MRKIIAIHQVTLDGVIQGPGGPEEDKSGGFKHGGWAAPFVDDTFAEELRKLMATDFDLLLGRRTYEIWEAYWPYQDNYIAGPFNKATKYVATDTLNELSWDRSERLSGDVAEVVRELKAGDGPEIHVWGSANLLQTLIAAELVDEFRLWVFPIIIGEGKKLFEKGLPPATFSTVSSKVTPAGLIYSTYRPAGPLIEGNLAEGTPTEAEIERRKKHNT